MGLLGDQFPNAQNPSQRVGTYRWGVAQTRPSPCTGTVNSRPVWRMARQSYSYAVPQAEHT